MNGKALLVATWKVKEWWEPLIDEAKARLFGIQLVEEFSFRNVVVESYCLHLVNAISLEVQGGVAFIL